MVRAVIVFILTLLFGGCSTIIQEPQSIDIDNQGLYKSYLNHYDYTLNLSQYINKVAFDCSALIMIINQKNNNIYEFDNLSKFYDRDGRRSQAMYNLYGSKNRLYYSNPRPGDLIFFNNTTHVTRNKSSHKITHIGIVTKVKSNGGIEFLHNINGRNIISVMNLQHKDTHKVDGKKINAYIIANCYEPSCLVSNRFSGFGRVDKNIYVK